MFELEQTPDLRKLIDFPRIDIGAWPTPIDEVELWEDQRVWIKRDDLCGHGRGGAKARKISHLVGYMLDQGYEELITVAGNVTNVIYDILPVLERHGLEHQLLIIDEPHATPAARAEIFSGVVDDVTLLGESAVWVGAEAIRRHVASRAAGKKSLLVLPGLSHPAAIAGNASGVVELVQQRLAMGEEPPDTIYITVATGSTIAGFLIAAHVLEQAGAPPIAIRGVQIYEGNIRLLTLALMRWTERFLGLEARAPAQRLSISQAQLHGGFGHFPRALGESCHALEERVGIAVDPIFGGKTWHAMEDELRARPRARPLYWHCGFTPEWEELTQRVEVSA